MKVGMILEGCACRAAFHAGAVDRLHEKGVQIGGVAGSSSGSVIATGLAFGRQGKMVDTWRNWLGAQVFQPKRLFGGDVPFRMTEITRAAVTAVVGAAKLSEANIPISIVCAEITRRGLVEAVFDRNSDAPVVDVVLSSTYIPGIYDVPQPIDGRRFLDGTLVSKAPVHLLEQLGCQKGIVIVSRPDALVLHSELQRSIIQPLPIHMRVLCPSIPLSLGLFDFNAVRTEAAFEEGRRAAELFMERNRRWLEG